MQCEQSRTKCCHWAGSGASSIQLSHTQPVSLRFVLRLTPTILHGQSRTFPATLPYSFLAFNMPHAQAHHSHAAFNYGNKSTRQAWIMKFLVMKCPEIFTHLMNRNELHSQIKQALSLSHFLLSFCLRYSRMQRRLCSILFFNSRILTSLVNDKSLDVTFTK